MKQHKLVFLVIIIILFILGGVFIFYGTRNSIFKFYDYYDNKIDEAVSVVKVPVANVDINTGDIINQDMLKVEEFQKNEIEDGVITSISDIIGKEVLTDIKEDDFIKESNLK